MKPMSYLAALLTALLLCACSQEQPPAEKPEPPAAEQGQSATQTAKQLADQAEQKIQETVAVAEEKAEALKQEAKQEVAAVKQEATEMAAEAKSTAMQATQGAKQAVTTVVADLKPAAPEPATTTQPVAGPGMVEYPASMGKVSFNHIEHAARLDCSKCHPTDPPQKIVINKEVAHTQLCKVCHKESGGNAPTACTGCHQK